MIDLEVTNKLFLELSQITTAKTAKEIFLEELLLEANDVLRTSMAIAERDGLDTGWEPFRRKLRKVLEKQHKILYPDIYET